MNFTFDQTLMTIDTILDSIYLLPELSKNKVKTFITEVHFRKGHQLFKAAKIETDIYFVKKGIVRAYADTAENQITFWFGKEGDCVLSMKSYVAQQKGYENIELLEDSVLFRLETAQLQQLYNEDIFIANWGRKLAENELIKTEERLISGQFKTATERYKELVTQNPDWIQRIQLGYIASYLGITQVSLSRIRAELKW